MKKIIALALSLVLMFSLVACASSGKDNNTTEKKDITLCLDWTPNTNHTGFYVALAKDYYADAGLNVTIVQPPEDGAEIMCASGEAQFAISFQDTLAACFASDSPLGITSVAAILQHNTSGIISRKGEGIDTPKGLEGKKYSTWNGPIELAMIKQLMTEDSGDFSKVKLIPNVVTDEASALEHKDTDAIWIYYAWGGIATELSGVKFDYFNFADLNPVFDYYTPVIVANNDFLNSDPETAKAFLSATKKGYEYAVENPDESAQILVDGDTTGSLKDSIELVKTSQEWISKRYIDDASQWGIFDESRWDNFYSWLWDNKLIEKELPAGTGFSNDYIA